MQALNMKYPDELCTPSARVYRPPDEPEYPLHDRTVKVTHCGRIYLDKRKTSLSRVFAGQIVGIREVAEKICLRLLGSTGRHTAGARGFLNEPADQQRLNLGSGTGRFAGYNEDSNESNSVYIYAIDERAPLM